MRQCFSKSFLYSSLKEFLCSCKQELELPWRGSSRTDRTRSIKGHYSVFLLDHNGNVARLLGGLRLVFIWQKQFNEALDFKQVKAACWQPSHKAAQFNLILWSIRRYAATECQIPLCRSTAAFTSFPTAFNTPAQKTQVHWNPSF